MKENRCKAMCALVPHFRNGTLLQKSEDCAVFSLSFLSGNGAATVYPLFSGIEMIALDIEAPRYCLDVDKRRNAVEINYCLAGRAECKMEDGCLQYIGQGDIFITTLRNRSDSIELPLSHYTGIVFYLDLDKIDTFSCGIPMGDAFDIKGMLTRFLEEDQCFMLPAREATVHFFAGLDSIDNERRGVYYRLKMLELMLYLESITPKAEKRTKAYTRSQVDTVKQIERHLTDDLSRRVTIDELSQEFRISATAIKSLFKDIYGKPISAYMKEYRLQRARDLLVESDHSIAEVAALVGYESQSKFGSVFREATGMTPYEYRKKNQ